MVEHSLGHCVSHTDRDLPSFNRPPVVEVAVGIQFEAVERLRNPHLGLLWDRYRKEFPKLEERHARPPVSESFEAAPAGQRQVRLQMLDRPDVSLVWFVSEEGNELIQVQRDRFVFNWRRQPGDVEYPRYG